MSRMMAGPKADLTFLLGTDERQKKVWASLRDSRGSHLLIVGRKGTGKSELLRAVAISLALRCRPSEIRLAAIDPTGSQLRVVEALPHATAALAETGAETDDLLAWLSDEARRRILLRASEPATVVLIDSLEGAVGGSPMRARRLEDVLRLGPLSGLHVIATAERTQPGIPWSARTSVVEAVSVGQAGWFRLRPNGPPFRASCLSVHELDRAVRWIRGERGGYIFSGISTSAVSGRMGTVVDA
jgi:hypothetical protein